jgi:NADPH:quinone reductase-like Zn-dependent oxidoreductase
MPVPLPFTPGIDVSGVVVEVGPGVRTIVKGQEVFGVARGSYAEFAVAAAEDLVEKPAGLDFAMAATLPVAALTAWKSVEDGGVREGQKVVVQGAAGGVGMFAVQFARLKGAKVAGTASAANIDFVKALGAEWAVDYGRPGHEGELAGADVVIDTVGGAVLEGSYALLKKGGCLVTVAGQVSEAKAKEAGIRALASSRGPTTLLGRIAELIAKKSIRTEVGPIFGLAEAKAAHDLSQSRHGRGRILLKLEK